jgi:hypothetical protein
MSQKQNFVNPAFREIYQGITAIMPQITFFGIVAVYFITAALNVFFIPLPIWLSIPAAAAIQFSRFSIVFMDFLNPTGRRSPWPGFIATLFTGVAIMELGFSIQHLEWIGAKWWSVFLFGAMIISGGFLLEINFIAKGAEAFGMKRRNEGAGAVEDPNAPSYSAQQAQQQAAPHTVPLEEEAIPFFDFSQPSTNGNGRH